MKTLLALALVALAVPHAALAADPVNCVGYGQSRQFVEAQSWWTEPGHPTAHAHLGACIPERENHRRGIVLNVRMVMHHMPPAAKFRYLSVVVKGRDYEITRASLDPDLRCAPGVMTCEAWHTFRVPLSAFRHSGLQELRLRGSVSPVHGGAVRPSLNWQTYIWNGKSRSNVTRQPYLRGKGWYTGHGYCEAGYRSDKTPLRDAPVSGLWTPLLRMTDHGSEDADPTFHTVRLDPNFHMDLPGALLREGQGGWQDYQRIDTLTLAAGQHKLFQRTDCANASGTNSGVLVVGFSSR